MSLFFIPIAGQQQHCSNGQKVSPWSTARSILQSRAHPIRLDWTMALLSIYYHSTNLFLILFKGPIQRSCHYKSVLNTKDTFSFQMLRI